MTIKGGMEVEIVKRKKMILVMMLILIVITTSNSVVFAADINPGVKFGDWVTTNVKGAFIGLVAIFGIVIAIKRSLMQGLTFIIIAGIGAVFVYGGDSVWQNLANLFGGFLK